MQANIALIESYLQQLQNTLCEKLSVYESQQRSMKITGRVKPGAVGAAGYLPVAKYLSRRASISRGCVAQNYPPQPALTGRN